MMKPHRGSSRSEALTQAPQGHQEPGLSRTSLLARTASAPRPGPSVMVQSWVVWALELPLAVVRGHATVPAMCPHPHNCPRAGRGKGQGRCGQSGDGSRQLCPLGSHVDMGLSTCCS